MSRSGSKNKSDTNKPRLFEEVLQVLQDSNKPLNYKQIATRLGLNDQSQKMLVNFILRDLANKKTIKEVGRGSYTIGENHQRKTYGTIEYVTGIADTTATGAAYIVVEGSDQ